MTDVRIVLDRPGIDRLIETLCERGFRVLGPTVRDEVIVYDEVTSTTDFPVGLRDEQEAGTYRLVRRDDEALFGYVVGPRSPKSFLHPPEVVVWSGERTEDGFRGHEPEPAPKYAFVGVRPCELAAVAVQDEVFMPDGRRDRVYAERRADAFFVAVNCVEPGGTCFCASMGTGPRATAGYDIALTEVLGGGRHVFVAESGSDEGAAVLDALEGAAADDALVAGAEALLRAAAGKMGRTLDTDGLRELLLRNLESKEWDRIAGRCLTCANCTLVCPTCFCATVEDTTDLSGDTASRTRRWDSCFNEEFSYIFGGPLRPSPDARYRQWMTHKLATWWDQFGTSGCVGCGRCITWCPVGIDITAEAAAIRASEEVKAGV
jgi:ferredoxin